MQSKVELFVAIGASAGGLEPLEGFFQSIPAKSNMAFFIIQHLSPDYKSLMDEILSRHTSLSINKVEDAMEVEPGSIYLIPAKKEMVIESGKLKLRDKSLEDQPSMPIDIFFKSLAIEAGGKAVGIVLSGSGSDGSRGVLDISRAGGLVIAQEVQSAKFPSMPQSAINSGVVDLVLKVEEMYATLLQYQDSPHTTRQTQSKLEHGEGEISDIIVMLREKYHIDFNLYKPGTIYRRIERRLSLKQCNSIEDYYEILMADEGELNSLFKDLLIGVTSFFRDPDAYAALEDLVLTDLLTAEDSGEKEIRIWVAGCATGEEVYSLAILCSEVLRQRRKVANVKFFATDVHRESLNHATTGIYNKSSLSGLSPDLLERWFEKIDKDSYQIHPDLRRMIVFAEHDILKDPPFTKINLLTCRNLLIYMQPAAQQKILSLFHFALKKSGKLFLGPSETLGDLEDEFEVLDKHWKLFRKKREVRLPAHLRFPLASTLGTTNMVPGRPAAGSIHIDQRLLRAYDSILEKQVASGFLINHYHELIHTFGDSRKLLLPPKGRTSLDILSMVEGELKIALAAAIQRAERERTTVNYKGIKTDIFDRCHQVAVIVDPLPDKISDSLYFFIVFQPMVSVLPAKEDENSFDIKLESGERIRGLEEEIQNLRENLQATVEELETSNEELQASNEELVASNEELQSTNEELHSVNEELYTVNAEYEMKIQELSEMTGDLDNLLDSTAIGTMFLDENFCIRKYTKPVTEVFNVLSHDLGRPIDHISNTIGISSLTPILKKVFEERKVHAEEVENSNGIWFLMRVLPYWGSDKEISGIVLTFVDITSRKDQEDEQIHLTEQLHHSHKMRAIGTLAGGIAHEFNNLLQAISSQMEMLSIKLSDDEEERESIEEVMQMTGRASELVKGILSFSHKSDQKKRFADLNTILENSTRLLEKTLPKNINLQVKLSEKPLVIKAENSQIEQVLFNLATNSRDAMAAGGQLLFSTDSVTLGDKEVKGYPSLKPGEYARLRVSDTGQGMAPEVAADIFNPFYTTKEVGQGTGIGLSIVYGIVASHNGYIECESAPDEGTVFSIYLPQMELGELPKEEEKKAPKPDEVLVKGESQGETIMVVDDEAAIRKICQRVFERAGFEVITARDGEEAVTTYQERYREIDLVLLDLGMPGMGGEKCLAELKKIDDGARIIIASGYLNHRCATDPEKFGAVKFMNKPYQVTEMVQEIRKILGRAA